MQVKDIVFLGAGASKSEGSPLQWELLHEFFKLEPNGPRHRALWKDAAAFFLDFFGVDVRSANAEDYPTYEEALGVLDLAIQRRESFKGVSLSPDHPEVQRARENLVYLMAILLEEKLKHRARFHRELVQRMKANGSLRSTAFISSNYDILIDNALIEAYPRYDLDYGVDFTNFTREQDWSRPRPDHEVFLFKVHGSLNWLYCPTCVALTLTPKEKVAASLVLSPIPCPDCQTPLTPIIVPPTYFKDLANVYLQEVWGNAGKMIRNAERLFFCGYSFPDADVNVKYLFKRGEMHRGHTPEVFVINGPKDWSRGKALEEGRRYLRFFKDPSQVHLTCHSFEEFCSTGAVD